MPSRSRRSRLPLAPLGPHLLALALGLSACAPAPRPAPPPAPSAPSPISVVDLRCEYLSNPLGIDTPRPRLYWVLESNERNQRQSAFEIDAVAEDGAPLWRSGKVASSRSTHVEWAGAPLVSGQRVLWKVRVWDQDDRVSAWSAPAFFEMALLSPSDWKGRWIGATDRVETTPTVPFPNQRSHWIWSAEAAPPPAEAAPPGAAAPPAAAKARAKAPLPIGTRYFRVAFDVPADRKPVKATASFAADDSFVLYMNGIELARGGSGELTPVVLSSILRPGRNVLAAAVTNQAGRAGFMGRALINFESGPRVEVVTAANWKVSAREEKSWTALDFDDARWAAATALEKANDPPRGRLPLKSVNVPPAPLLRKAFTLGKAVKAARAYVAGLGYHELYVNGQRIGDGVLAPGFTRYDRRVLYRTYDVTSDLRAGANAVGVMLGNGFFNQHAQDAWDFTVAPWRASPRLLLQLDVTYQDGTREQVVTDETWQVATGPIVFDGIRNGESYDARLERPGWSTPEEAAVGGWRPAHALRGPAGVLSAEMEPPIKVGATIKPVKVTEPKPGVFVFDLAQNISGWARLRVRGPAGTTVTLRYGERLAPDGTIDQKAIAEHVYQGRFQTDTYTLRGGGGEEWEPRFTYHGFQYVEVTGYPGRPTVDDLDGRFVHTDFPQTGTFASSNDLFNKIQELTLRSYRANYVGIPTDCPQREKNGWMADAHLAAELAMFNFDNAAAYTRWVRDMRDEQRESGELPGIVPTGGWGYAWGNGPAWESAYIIIPFALHDYVGDLRIVAEHFDRWKKWVDYTGTVNYWEKTPGGWLGDWVPAKQETPATLVVATYHYLGAKLVARAARLLGRADDAARYDGIAEEVRGKWRAKYVDAATGQIGNGSQTSLAGALYSGLVEAPAERERTLAHLLANIEARGGHLDAGVIGTKFLPHVLTDAGRADVFFRIANQRDYPSWGHWIEKGATSLWEDWPGVGSLNHIFIGDISAWFWKALAGINVDPAAPGFERIVIKPEPVGDLTWARGETRTIRGTVASAWKLEGGRFSLDIQIPVGSAATVYVPASRADRVSADGARWLRAEAGRQVYEVGSGRYSFVAAH